MERVIVKIGSSSLTTPKGELHLERIAYFSGELAALTKAGYEVVVVTSGAVAAGYRTLGFEERPHRLHEIQAAAAVGQARLMQAYQENLVKHKAQSAQILLTRSDFSNRRSIGYAKQTIEELLARHIIPIINENDTVSVEELNFGGSHRKSFGDNDRLSALVANLMKAQQLIIITDTDGLYTDDPRRSHTAKRIERVNQISEQILEMAGGAGSSVGTGGMRSKLEAARIAIRGGIPVFVGKLSKPHELMNVLQGEGKGTYFTADLHTLSMKQQWITFHSESQGKVFIDEGAVRALLTQGRSLLPAGVLSSEGDFFPGDVVDVLSPGHVIIGRGIVNYTSAQLQAAAGLNTKEAMKRLELVHEEVVHRNEWVSLFLAEPDVTQMKEELKSE